MRFATRLLRFATRFLPYLLRYFLPYLQFNHYTLFPDFVSFSTTFVYVLADLGNKRGNRGISLFGVVWGLGNSCLTTLRLLRVGRCCGCSDLVLILFFGWSLFVVVDHLDYLVSSAALILFDQESPSPLTYLNNCVSLNHRDSRFFFFIRWITIKDAEVHLIQCEKSRISTLLGVILSAHANRLASRRL